MRLLLIRHGETDHNAGGLTLGRKDVPLNERGRAAAQTIARRYADGAEAIAAVYASPLARAIETARPLAGALGLEVRAEPGLIEMDVGEVEDKTYAQVREQYADFLRLWRSDQCADARMPGGETLREVQARAWAAVEAIRDGHPEETVAAVTHNFVILTVLCQVMQVPLQRFRALRQDLGAVSLLELTADRCVVVSMNDRCHL
jgi:probable phosphoglycerate mutase